VAKMNKTGLAENSMNLFFDISWFG